MASSVLSISSTGITLTPYGKNLFKDKETKLPKRYIINRNACICFWEEKEKTISKVHKEDVLNFDKELGFLLACWQHYNKDLSKATRKRILACIKTECMKDYLFEYFRIETKMETEKARGYLRNLKIEKVKEDK